MTRKAMVFPNKTRRLDAFNKFKEDFPDNKYHRGQFKAISSNTEIFFLCPDDINDKMLGQTFHEVVIIEKIWLTQDEMSQLQLTVLSTGGMIHNLGRK